MDYKRAAGKILEEISHTLDGFAEQQDAPGLLGGYTGTALFYAYYYQLTGKRKYLRKVYDILQRCIQALAEVPLPFSHCNGIAGIAWCIQHLLKAGFVTEDGMSDIFEEVDEILGSEMQEEVLHNHYDFLHEGLGIALYFLEKDHHPDAEMYLTNIVAQLEKAALKMNRGISWQDHLTKPQEHPIETVSFNMGLAHGVPAIISILAAIHSKGIAVEKTRNLIGKGIDWILSNRNIPGDGVSALFPVLVDADNKPLTGKQSRLGWCYGDLSIATLLLNAGTSLNNNTYTQQALEIFIYTVQHRNEKNSSVHDACLCHGSAGISHIYRRAWLQTKEPILLKGAEYWLQQTLQMNKHVDGVAGFRFYGKEDYEIKYGMLEGITGVGLALIAAIDSKNYPAWDRCLLLS
jgi:lantibiotic modifying enzyme